MIWVVAKIAHRMCEWRVESEGLSRQAFRLENSHLHICELTSISVA